MSHFTVMVIGENPEQQLAPFQENNMGDCPKQYLEYIKDDDGTGYYENPNAKWDWYLLGGRWTGSIKLKIGSNGNTGQVSLIMGSINPGIDQAKKKDIDNWQELSSFAFLKDGKWAQKGDMGWFGVVIDENKDWPEQLQELKNQVNDNDLVSIYDCHI